MDTICLSEEFGKFIKNERDHETREWKVFSKFMLDSSSLDLYLASVREHFETFSIPSTCYLSWSSYGYYTDAEVIRPDHGIGTNNYDGGINSQGISFVCAIWDVMKYPIDIVKDTATYIENDLCDGRLSVVYPNLLLEIKHIKLGYNPKYISNIQLLLSGSSIPMVYSISERFDPAVIEKIVRNEYGDGEYADMNVEDILIGLKMLCIKWQIWIGKVLYSSDILTLRGMRSYAKSYDGKILTYMGSDSRDNLIRNITKKYPKSKGPKNFYLYEESRT